MRNGCGCLLGGIGDVRRCGCTKRGRRGRGFPGGRAASGRAQLRAAARRACAARRHAPRARLLREGE